MGDFSTVDIDSGCGLFPRWAWRDRFQCFQSKDFPEHESETACIDGTIRSDGLFVRHDGRWNSELNGWVRMRSSFPPTAYFNVLFLGGKAVEVKEGEPPQGFYGPLAWDSPNNWQDVPLTI